MAISHIKSINKCHRMIIEFMKSKITIEIMTSRIVEEISKMEKKKL